MTPTPGSPSRRGSRSEAARLFVARGRVRVPLVFERQLVLVVLAADLCPRFLVGVGLPEIRLWRLVGRRGHLIRVVVVDPGLHPLLFGQAGKLVVVEVPRDAAVLTPVAVELLGWLAWVLLCHHASTRSAPTLLGGAGLPGGWGGG